MESGTLGFEEWLPRRTALLTALAIWVIGLALAGASAWRMQHPAVRAYETNEAPTPAVATPDEAPAETTESEGAVLLPEDLVVGRRTPTTGVTQLQKP
jgi:hypothetical protein